MLKTNEWEMIYMKKSQTDKSQMEKRLVKAGLALLAMGGILLAAARTMDGFADWYSSVIYPVCVSTLGRAMGIFPFSMSEIFLYLLLAGCLLWIIRSAFLHCAAKKKEKRLKRGAIGLFLLASILFFLYTVNCGVNYYRETFSESAGIKVEEYSVEELKEVCRWLTDEVNESSDTVKRDEKGLMTLADADVEQEAVVSMKNLGKEYEALQGYYPKPKPLLNHWILSIQNLTGVYSPFTVEANYNNGMVDYNIPFTACHELSHLRGFMEEKEANYIGFLACLGSDVEEFRYSGYLMGWIYCTNVLYEEDYEAWEELRGELKDSVLLDLQANSDFWAKYDTAVAEVSDKINDTYLKANGQQDGVESYDRMVDLIVTEYMNGEIGRVESRIEK